MASPRPQSGDQTTIGGLFPEVPGSFPSLFPASGSSNQLSLTQAVHARRAEYVRPKSIRIKIGSWNTAAFKGTEKDLGGWFVKGQGISDALSGLQVSEGDQQNERTNPKEDDSAVESPESIDAQESRYKENRPTLPKDDPGGLPGGEDIGLYLLALQEVVDVTSASEAFRPYTDPEPAGRWKAAAEAALPPGYVLVAEQQLIGLLLLVYAAPDVAPDVKSVSTTSVGTGLMGYMGNKGAVTARLVLGETTRLVFVNSHLAAGADKTALDRRNWDYSQIVTRTKFEPIRDSMDLWQAAGESIDDADFAFWAGDLNYRLADIPGDDVRRLLMLHTRDEYDLTKASGKKVEKALEATEGSSATTADRTSIDDARSSITTASDDTKDSEAVTDQSSQTTVEDTALDPGSDPASLQTTLASLLPHDELQQQIAARKAFYDGWKEGPITFLPTYKYDPGSVGVFDSSEKKRAPSWCDRILYRTRRDKLAFESKLAEEADAHKKDAEMKKNGIDEAAKDEELLYDYDPDEDADDQEGYDDSADKPEGVVITKEGFEDEVHLEYYAAHQRVLSSDHKPLDAVFRLKYNYIVPELKAKIHQQVARELDKAENEGRPSVTVVVDKHHADDPDISDENPMTFEGVNFRKIRYSTRKERSLTIANTGQVPATVTFVDRPVGAGQKPGPSPVWLKVDMDPEEDEETSKKHFTGPRTLEPGDVCNVDLKLRVRDRHLIKALNEGIKSLDDILVLRVENGRDHFIPIRGKWMETSLGRSIDKLVRIPEGGIRRLQNQQPKAKSGGTVAEEMPIKWSAPRELFRLTDNAEKLTELCIAEWEMTSSDKEAPWVTTAGWPFAESSWTATTYEQRHELSGAVCDALDNSSPLDDCLPKKTPKLAALETLSAFLLEYLESMPDGIITEPLWEKLQEAQLKGEHEKKDTNLEDQRTAAQEIMSESPPHSISFILLTSMLDRIISEQIASTLRRPDQDQFQVPPPLKRTGSLRKKEMSKEPKTAYRQIITRKMADIFSKAIIRAPEPEKNREKAALDDRKTRFVELFLTKDEP